MVKLARPILSVLATALSCIGGVTAEDGDYHSELVLLVTLSRHGSRAPNPIVKKLCPNNLPNIKSYEVPMEQLTERGMEQLDAAGRHIRDVYVNNKAFLSSSFNGRAHEHFEAYFRADAANRCGQSATALGYGLYPDGTGPKGYQKQPIPVYMQLSENEHDFTGMGPCWTTMQADGKAYSRSKGAELITQHAELLSQVATICGSDFQTGNAGEGAVAAIKDISDMFLFDQDEELPPTAGLTPTITTQLSQLAFRQLIERLYSSPRQITYVIGGFPQMLMRNLNDATSPNFDPEQSTKYYSYHGHRELLHGLGFMIGMKFHFDGLPEYNGSTPLIPGTTLFFELHRVQSGGTDANAPIQHFVRLYVWTPKTERTLVKLENCAADCPLSEFNAILTGHIRETGSWQDICGYHPVVLRTPILPSPELPNAAQTVFRQTMEADHRNKSTTSRSMWQWVFPSLLLVAVGALSALAYKRFRRRRYEYQPL